MMIPRATGVLAVQIREENEGEPRRQVDVTAAIEPKPLNGAEVPTVQERFAMHVVFIMPN
jgi:hypothetical protein